MTAARTVAGAERARGGALGLCRESGEPALDNTVSSDLPRIVALLYGHTSHDFSQYKKSALLRGIQVRMVQRQMPGARDYVRCLEESPEEVQLLFSELLIRATRFFRDPEAFATLETDILPELLRDRPAGCPFQAWAPGCATGEEPYSLAILLQEASGATPKPRDFHVFATDIDQSAVVSARTGTFPAAIARDVGAARLRRFFKREHLSYRLNDEVRARVTFTVRNVALDSHSGLDLISCRNLMIYLEPELQDLLLQAFHRALRPGGVLFLSPSESIGDAAELFTPVSRKWKLYRANALEPVARSPVSTRSRSGNFQVGG